MWERALYLTDKGHAVTVVAGGFADAARNEVISGINVVRLGGGILSLWWRTFFYYMTRLRGKYDVAVVEGFGGSRIPRFTPLYVKEPIITEWHQIHRDLFAVQYPRLLGPALNTLERLTAFVHRNTVVMARTREWQEAFSRIGFKADRIFIVPACISEDWLKDDKIEPVTEPQIVWLGKFRRYKCPDHAIRAMREVVQAVPNARLVLAGRHDDRKYEAELFSLVEELGLRGVVEFQFGITEAQKRALLKSSRVMVLPSSVEGFGIVVLEANASGVPLIASSGVPASAVKQGFNGQRYPFADIGGLARCLVAVLTDDKLYGQLSANSLAFAKQFAWRDVCAEYERVIAMTADSHRHAG